MFVDDNQSREEAGEDPDVAPVYREPETADGARIWTLVHDAGVLDLNSSYCYLLLCAHHADTCVLAEHEGELLGFVTGYRPPKQPDTYFLWQVGVDQGARGLGLATKMALSILSREACADVRYLETTVTPSNTPSQELFQSIARRLDTECHRHPFFDASMFPDSGHEPEELYRIGPFTRESVLNATQKEGL